MEIAEGDRRGASCSRHELQRLRGRAAVPSASRGHPWSPATPGELQSLRSGWPQVMHLSNSWCKHR